MSWIFGSAGAVPEKLGILTYIEQYKDAIAWDTFSSDFKGEHFLKKVIAVSFSQTKANPEIEGELQN